MAETRSDELAQSIFLKAKEEHSASRRWVFIIIVFALFLHITTFSQYLKTKADLVAAQKKSERLAGAQAEVRALTPQLAALEAGNNEVLKELGEKLFMDLMTDLTSLDRSIKAASSHSGSGNSTEPPRRDDLADSMAIQSPLQAGGSVQAGREFDFDEEMKGKIRDASADRDRLRQILLPYVREKIILPRFAEARAEWAARRLPAIESGAASIIASTGKAAALLPEEQQQLEAIGTGAQRLVEEAKTIKFEPPANDEWWHSAAGKFDMAGTLTDAKAKQLSQIISSDAAEKLKKETEDAAEKAKSVEASLAASVNAIKDQFAKQQEQAASLAKPFSFVSFDIDFLVSRFPILLGLAVGGSIFWLSYKKLELARALRLLRGQDDTARAWYEIFNLAPSPDLRDVIVPAAAGTLWVLLAAAQNLYWGGKGLAGVFMLLLAGVLPIAFGTIYHWQTVHEAAALEGAPPAAPADTTAAPLTDKGASNFTGVHK